MSNVEVVVSGNGKESGVVMEHEIDVGNLGSGAEARHDMAVSANFDLRYGGGQWDFIKVNVRVSAGVSVPCDPNKLREAQTLAEDMSVMNCRLGVEKGIPAAATWISEHPMFRNLFGGENG